MDFSKHLSFDEFVADVNKRSPVKIKKATTHPAHLGIGMVNHTLPISVNESEFNYLHDIIVKYNLTRGYDLATGTGTSMYAIGTAMKKTGGKVVTADSYEEETTKKLPMYAQNQKSYKNCDGYKVADFIIQEYNLQDTVIPIVGWSPRDTIPEIARILGRVDFVFLDCPKSDEDFEREIRAIYPLLAEKYVICIHDSHTFTDRSDRFLIELFGKTYERKHTYEQGTIHEKTWHFPLGVLTNIF